MKKLLTFLLVAGALTARAQTNPQGRQPVPVTIILPDTAYLSALKQVLATSYNYLPTSRMSAVQATDTKTAIEQLFPLLVPVRKDTTITVKPPAKKQ